MLHIRSALDYRGKIADETSWQTSRVKNEIDTVTHGRLQFEERTDINSPTKTKFNRYGFAQLEILPGSNENFG